MQNNEFLNFSTIEKAEISSNNFFIYRIFTFDRFIDLLKSQSLTFVKPELWDDKYEKILSNNIISHDTKQKFYLGIFNYLYAQCWCMSGESDAMWRIYSQDKKGILVKVNLLSLLNSLKSDKNIEFNRFQKISLGKVVYETEEQIKNKFSHPELVESYIKCEQDIINTLFLKRDSFEHEKEVRVIFTNKISDDSNPKFISLNIDSNDLFNEITLDPRLDDIDFQRQKYLLESVGFSGIIKKSSLYNMPNINLTINSFKKLLSE